MYRTVCQLESLLVSPRELLWKGTPRWGAEAVLSWRIMGTRGFFIFQDEDPEDPVVRANSNVMYSVSFCHYKWLLIYWKFQQTLPEARALFILEDEDSEAVTL